MHIPVLLQEVIKFLDPKAGKKYIDATIGEGGHAKVIMDRGGILLGIDRDLPSVIASASEAIPLMNNKIASSPPAADSRNDRLKVVQGNFADLKEIAEDAGFAEVDGILFDLGLGSHQLDDPKRGFSFQKDGPLDMRYDRERKTQSEKRKTAADIVNVYSEKGLIDIFRKYGEEHRFAKKIARAVVETRKSKHFETTTELFELIKKALPGNLRFRAGDTARRIFQALRIEVNEELKNLEKALPQALDLLAKGGRLVVISFHSLEDRIVKIFFVQNTKDCICPVSFPVCRCDAKASLRILTKKPVMASLQEIKLNPRSHSAKLRVVQKL